MNEVEDAASKIGLDMDDCSCLCEVSPRTSRANVCFDSVTYNKKTLGEIQQSVVDAGYSDPCLFKYKVTIYEKRESQ